MSWFVLSYSRRALGAQIGVIVAAALAPADFVGAQLAPKGLIWPEAASHLARDALAPGRRQGARDGAHCILANAMQRRDVICVSPPLTRSH